MSRRDALKSFVANCEAENSVVNILWAKNLKFFYIRATEVVIRYCSELKYFN